MLWLVGWTKDLTIGDSSPSPCRRVVSLDEKLYSTQVYKMGTDDILLGVTLRWASIPSRGGVAILSVASCLRNRVKFRPCGPPRLMCKINLYRALDNKQQVANSR